VSQARPYLIPFLSSSANGPSSPTLTTHTRSRLTSLFLRLCTAEITHRLTQLDSLNLVPASIRRFLVDEHIPAASLLLVPQLSLADFGRLLEVPTKENLEYWIRRGEQSVWPSLGALKVRGAVEVELDRGYQFVRRRKAGGLKRRGSKVIADTAGISAAVERARYGGIESKR
jgi:TAG lipase/lysophosphatidylethanolamine acyltransferase